MKYNINMKKLSFIILLCLGLLAPLTAQNVWKTINIPGDLFGVAANGDLFSGESGIGILRSQDEGETWQNVLEVTYHNNYFNGFTISPQGRIFALPYNGNHLYYSDNGGDTWQTTADCFIQHLENMPMYALSDDTLFIYGAGYSLLWTIDGGNLWNETTIDFVGDAMFGSILADHAGNVYVSTYRSWTYPDPGEAGIYTANLDDMTNWTMKAPGTRDMAFDSQGNILASNRGSAYYENGVYYVNADRFAVTDDDVIFAMRRVDWDNEALFYTIDYGQTYTSCSEDIPSTTTAPDPDLGLFKGCDNHLYCRGEVWEPNYEIQYYKSINEADMIVDPMGGYFPRGTEWYYEIKHLTGGITYQHLEYTADTAINSKRVKIITATNTMYDKSTWTDVEYIYEDGDRIYWWNRDLEDFTLLYDFGAEVGDEWEINGGWFTITVHVDGVDETTLQGKTYRVLHVTDPNYQLFTGDIICGIGHQKSFFPLSPIAKEYYINGLRCFWQDGELLFTMGEEDCDAVYYEIHGVEEGDEKGFVVYPNPVNDMLFVESASGSAYRITNLLGQTLKSGHISADRQQIDVHDLTEGVYFITVGEITKVLLKSL